MKLRSVLDKLTEESDVLDKLSEEEKNEMFSVDNVVLRPKIVEEAYRLSREAYVNSMSKGRFVMGKKIGPTAYVDRLYFDSDEISEYTDRMSFGYKTNEFAELVEVKKYNDNIELEGCLGILTIFPGGVKYTMDRILGSTSLQGEGLEQHMGEINEVLKRSKDTIEFLRKYGIETDRSSVPLWKYYHHIGPYDHLINSLLLLGDGIPPVEYVIGRKADPKFNFSEHYYRNDPTDRILEEINKKYKKRKNVLLAVLPYKIPIKNKDKIELEEKPVEFSLMSVWSIQNVWSSGKKVRYSELKPVNLEISDEKVDEAYRF